ncbi:MAG: hypothetical protein ACPGLY_09190 [Rubripirellula sp.]
MSIRFGRCRFNGENGLVSTGEYDDRLAIAADSGVTMSIRGEFRSPAGLSFSARSSGKQRIGKT